MLDAEQHQYLRRSFKSHWIRCAALIGRHWTRTLLQRAAVTALILEEFGGITGATEVVSTGYGAHRIANPRSGDLSRDDVSEFRFEAGRRRSNLNDTVRDARLLTRRCECQCRNPENGRHDCFRRLAHVILIPHQSSPVLGVRRRAAPWRRQRQLRKPTGLRRDVPHCPFSRSRRCQLRKPTGLCCDVTQRPALHPPDQQQYGRTDYFLSSSSR